MSAPSIRLSPLHRRLAYATFAALWASGAAWLLFHYFLYTEGEFGPAAHPLEAWWLRLHGLAAMLALVALGSLATHHMRIAWGRRRNLRTGLPMLALSAWLAATGYALYYFTSDDNAAWLPRLHWIAGLALPVWLFIHVPRRRPQRARGPIHVPRAGSAHVVHRHASQEASS